ncbi:MAG: spore coat protein [Clostridiales bacterium]|nr:spore coat protein [Clostridiales bacterium]
MEQSTCFGDKEMLHDALCAQKEETANYNLFANECVHKDLRDTYMNILNEEHDLQYQVFNIMHERGLYPTPAAEQEKINQAIQKYSQQATMK